MFNDQITIRMCKTYRQIISSGRKDGRSPTPAQSRTIPSTNCNDVYLCFIRIALKGLMFGVIGAVLYVLWIWS